jgi:hypothetical protein
VEAATSYWGRSGPYIGPLEEIAVARNITLKSSVEDNNHKFFGLKAGVFGQDLMQTKVSNQSLWSSSEP